MMQTVISILVLTVAISYIVWRIQKLWFSSSNPCQGCNDCAFKKQVCDKKRDKKFG